jgi:hypothetical protein
MKGMMSSVENRLNQKLKEWGISVNTFTLLAALTGDLSLKSRSAAARTLNGLGLPFGAEDQLSLNRLVRDVDAIVSAAHPLPLNLKNPAVVSELVQAWRGGELLINVKKGSHDLESSTSS